MNNEVVGLLTKGCKSQFGARILWGQVVKILNNEVVGLLTKCSQSEIGV